jgi:hypothetical protein
MDMERDGFTGNAIELSGFWTKIRPRIDTNCTNSGATEMCTEMHGIRQKWIRGNPLS